MAWSIINILGPDWRAHWVLTNSQLPQDFIVTKTITSFHLLQKKGQKVNFMNENLVGILTLFFSRQMD